MLVLLKSNRWVHLATTRNPIINRWFSRRPTSLLRARHQQSLYAVVQHQKRTASTIHPFPPQPKSYPYDVTIGSTTVTVRSSPRNPELIPLSTGEFLTPTDLTHLEWMMKKEALLRQDMFLIGPPGGYKRRLLGLYAQLFGRELEVIQISRDSTEADIKQIREIRGKTVVYFDQASVRAALNGHILVLDGIEKAERNVLPLLNNLLENREMHLEDGRHLIPYTRYDQLVKKHGLDAVKRWKLERVHPDFRVCALGLPIPAFRGNPLDPPLRSRFQGRNVGGGFGRAEVLDLLAGSGKSKDVDDGVRRIVDLAFGINFMNSREFKERLGGDGDFGKRRAGEDVPWFVVDSLFDGVRVFKNLAKSSSLPSTLLPAIFRLMYPFKSSKIESLITEQLGEPPNLQLNTVPANLLTSLQPAPLQSQISTLSLLHEFLQLKDCRRAALLYGGQGCGKSTVAGYVGELLGGRAVTVVQAYKDMSTRDLFQVRGTDMDGDTVWRESPLVEAAVAGGVCVVDGVEHLHESVVGVLGGLVREGAVMLPDGVTVLGSDAGGADGKARRRLPIHPDFRLIGVADSSDLKLTPELCSVFMVFGVGMAAEEEAHVCGGGEEVAKVLSVLRELRRRGAAGDKGCLALSRGLSVAQVKRIGRRLEGRRARGMEGDGLLRRDVLDALCGQFLPMMERAVLGEVLDGAGIRQSQVSASPYPREVSVEDGRFRIGFVNGNVHSEAPEFVAKVPRGGVFFDIEQHVGVLERLADDFLNGGDHLLVVGNQGVGKNKIVDRFLGVVGRGREYLQLHRDTTVQSLTTNQRIEAGVIKVEDSPLVSAVRHGLVLVIDEADKAPAHVTAVLKTLAERGEMVLGDGRRIVRSGHGNERPGKRLIQLHPDFRMVVLANRPGFPFLGNSFYGSMSHLFSVNPVDNPGVESEVELLNGYGAGGVEQGVVRGVAKVFGELRGLSDEGVLAYPYSTREAVHVVSHLKRFPGEVGEALGSVFDFDEWGDDERWRVLKRVVDGGLGEGVLGGKSSAAHQLKIVEWGKKGGGGGEGGESSRKDFSRFGDPKEGKFDASGGAHVGGNTWAGGSGGMSTAGLGGVGGPYRLSDGNPVFQVSAQTKSAVPPEVVQKARELNRQLYAERLRELGMSANDSSMYNELLEPIRPQIRSLRNILESLNARSEERKWVKHQTSGDLDEGKLVEGLIGERDVYRGRLERRPEPGDPLVKPKLLRLLVDVSGSMYRFNGYDRRLERVLSAVLMVMEGAADYGHALRVEVFGHSGDEYDWEVVGRASMAAENSSERSRLAVLKQLFLHSQFCSSGDHTLEATASSIEQLRGLKDEFDELFLVVLSDANLERYGIRVEEFAEVLRRGDADGVKAYSVFIGSLGDQAERLTEGLGAGRGFVCLDVGELPRILGRVFAEGVLRG